MDILIKNKANINYRDNKGRNILTKELQLKKYNNNNKTIKIFPRQ